MPNPTFRYARLADTPALVGLIERAYRDPRTAGDWASEAHLLTGPRTSHDEIAGLISREDSRFLIAELDGKLAGCCLLQALPSEGCAAAYFGMFAIEPRVQGAGLGKQVIAEAERRVGELWDAREMVMTVINLRSALIAWYERRGYRLTGVSQPFPFSETSGETRRDFDLAEMRKRLS